MLQDNLSRKQRGARPVWFNVLLLLDMFALGGLAVWRLVLSFLDRTMHEPGRIGCFGEIPHILDKLLPYWLGHTGLALLLLLITALAYVWVRTTSSSARELSTDLAD